MAGRSIRSIELVLDAGSDAIIRAQWRSLGDAGLPTLAGNAHPSNRPHVTLVASDQPFAAGLERASPTLPVPVRLGGLLLFGAGRGRGMVLGRAVVPSPALLDLHAEVLRRCGGAPTATSAVGAWTPHVTLARRLDAVGVATALGVLDGAEHDGSAVGLRLWDAGTRTVTPLAGEV